ncbi:hypothetical protein EF888_07860 [Silicimonas algicola]|uniref:Uncharacterized protein n=1 Tax=Silicimonas algicola TaxID=1826607 RepID=A0A316G3A3_9RHOB|nr:hypothetical protein [Silicimonas algicola]AZQ67056.1 hypothetical protein EF888_07860 [Silicimonas algicola]PWK55421.1 hypothetical protein C8D95_10787 [Silicimonas algicola]
MTRLALVLVFLVSPAGAEPLDGAFRGVFNELTLSVTEGKAVAEVSSGACLGYLEGGVTEVAVGRWEILGSVPEAPCVLSLTRGDDGRIEMMEGPGCTFYHGMSCELSGILEAAK